jgi:hypothetical protein
MPVYILQAKKGEPVTRKRLVRANSKSQAIRFVAESMFACEVATGETVADLMRVGFPCEDARTPETADLPLENGNAPTPPVDSGPAASPPTDSVGVGFSREAWPDGEPIDSIDTVSILGMDHVS